MAVSSSSSAEKKGLFFGWIVLAASTLICIIGYGTYYYGFSQFQVSMFKEFGWTRAGTAGAFSALATTGMIAVLFIGPFIDKFGARITMTIGSVIFALAFYLLGTTQDYFQFYLYYGVILALGVNSILYVPTQAALAKWFNKKRSTVLGILTTGGALGGTLIVPILPSLIENLGWRGAFQALAAVQICLFVPLAWFGIRNKPEDLGLLPDGEAPGQAKAASTTAATAAAKPAVSSVAGFSLRDAVKTPAFWILSFAFFFNGLGLASIVVHQAAYLETVGIRAQDAANILAFMTTVSIPGRLALGWLGDKIDKRYMLAASYSFQCVGLLLFTQVAGIEMGYLSMLVYGLGYGAAIPLAPAVVAQYFGAKNFATIRAYQGPITRAATVLGPLFAGIVFDMTQSYIGAFFAIAAAFVLAVICIFFAKPPKTTPAPAVRTQAT